MFCNLPTTFCSYQKNKFRALYVHNRSHTMGEIHPEKVASPPQHTATTPTERGKTERPLDFGLITVERVRKLPASTLPDPATTRTETEPLVPGRHLDPDCTTTYNRRTNRTNIRQTASILSKSRAMVSIALPVVMSLFFFDSCGFVMRVRI